MIASVCRVQSAQEVALTGSTFTGFMLGSGTIFTFYNSPRFWPNSPGGTSGNSPAIYRWVPMESLRPVGTADVRPSVFSRPYGTCLVYPIPTDESVGYSQASLR